MTSKIHTQAKFIPLLRAAAKLSTHDAFSTLITLNYLTVELAQTTDSVLRQS